METKIERRFTVPFATLTALATFLAATTQARTIIPQITLVYGVDANLMPWIYAGPVVCEGSSVASMDNNNVTPLTQPQEVAIESSTNMQNWRPIYSNMIGATTTNTVDAPLSAAGFFRLKISPFIVTNAPVATLTTPYNGFAPDERAIGSGGDVAGIVYLTWTNASPSWWKCEVMWVDNTPWEDMSGGILDHNIYGALDLFGWDTLGGPPGGYPYGVIVAHYERFTGLDSSGNVITGVSNPVNLWDIGM